MLAQASALLAFAAVGSSHLIMEFPVPFAWQDEATKQAPLAMGDFPCKQSAGAYKVTTMNTWNAGETQSVKIIGGATHGGGSCQFSITTDTKPTKDSQWKVIHSMIGGCPGGPSDNNLSNNPTDASIPGIPVTMPEDVPSGQYTFAWSWVNKIGNREFYMNCAPIQVGSGSGPSTASADVASALGQLPDMFTINLGPGCSTAEGQDFSYPNPGKSTVTSPGAQTGSSTTGSNCAAMEKLGAGKGSLGAPSQGESPSAPSQPAGSDQPAPPSQAPSSTAKPAPTNGPGGIFAPGASSAPAAQPTAQPPASQPPTAQPSTAPSNGTPAQGAGDCVPCSNDGAVVCIGSSQFGLCNRGCAVPQALAAGMACVNGAINAAAKRHIHVPRAHLRSFVH
jgi:hypothetical protein